MCFSHDGRCPGHIVSVERMENRIASAKLTRHDNRDPQMVVSECGFGLMVSKKPVHPTQTLMLRSELSVQRLPALPSTRIMAACAAAAASETAAAAAPGTPDKVGRVPGERRKQGKIDYDHNIALKKVEMKELSRSLKRTKADSRNEKRKKQRLVRKAAQLTIVDLHRIAALKKAGIWDPGLGLSDVPWAAADVAAADEAKDVAASKDIADTSGAASAPPAPTRVDLEATNVDPAKLAAVPMSVDAPDDGSDVEEAVP